MKTIVNWTAKRAGARITIIGEVVGSTREPIKLVGVTQINGGAELASSAGDRGAVTATGPDGEVYRLL